MTDGYNRVSDQVFSLEQQIQEYIGTEFQVILSTELLPKVMYLCYASRNIKICKQISLPWVKSSLLEKSH